MKNHDKEQITPQADLRKIIHIGWMRTGTTYLQGIFGQHPRIHASLKNRFFSYDPYFEKGESYYQNILAQSTNEHSIFVDSDENYAMGRFKTVLREHESRKFNLKSELSFISHDISKMIDRLKTVVPDAQIVAMIRKQPDWFTSVYKHDVANFALDQSFEDFYHSELGTSYRLAADYYQVIQQLWDTFGKENVKIFLFEDFKQENDLFLRELSAFMGVELSKVKKSKLKKNISPDNFFTSVYRRVNKLSEKDVLKPESATYWKVRRLVEKAEIISRKANIKISKKLIPDALKASIFEQYRDGNQKLAAALGKESSMRSHGYY